jgi:hypothetical protein
MRLRSTGLDELLDEVGYVLNRCADLESRITRAVIRAFYRFTRASALAALRRAAKRGL